MEKIHNVGVAGCIVYRIADIVDRVHYQRGAVNINPRDFDVASAAPPALDDIALLGSEAGGDNIIYLARHTAEGLCKLVALDFGCAVAVKHFQQKPCYLIAKTHFHQLFSFMSARRSGGLSLTFFDLCLHYSQGRSKGQRSEKVSF